MLHDILKIIIGTVLGVGLTELFRRRNSKAQGIPLIERVNRLITADTQEITFARVLQNSADDRQLEQVASLREYQLTLRNTSMINLQDVEVQFDFSSEDIQSWVSRPVLSKTSLIEVSAATAKPWKRAFRWRIPHFPPGDSVEFNFQVIDSAENVDYVVALYHSDRVIVEKVVVEPIAPRMRPEQLLWATLATIIAGALLALFYDQYLIIKHLKAPDIVTSNLLVSNKETRGQRNIISVPKNAAFVLHFALPPNQFDSYQVQIIKIPDTVKMSLPLNNMTDDSIRMLLSTRSLVSGDYDVVILGLKSINGKQEVDHEVVRYRFTLAIQNDQ